MTDSREIRDLTRALKENAKATEALNKTLIAIERARVEAEAEYCRECNAAICMADVPNLRTTEESKNCPCCKVGHVRDAFQAYITGS